MKQEKREMEKRQRDIELLAPAGSREAFYGAVHAGADAIYLGGEKFGARAYADNFTAEELLECIRYGHIHGCRSYLTVNTLMKEQELAELTEALAPLYEAGLDGVIVQDIGALQVIRQHFPELELHASTQMTVTGPAGAGLLKELGVVRVVPARELSLRELQLLKTESGLEVETFIHGAMCYCYSGSCLLSSILGGRSGNRGRCAQPCRLSYGTDSPGASVHRKEYYPLSLKDMCTIEHLPELMEGGIDSFKIEGRMKKPEYAAGVTAIYRKYIDRYLAHPKEPFSVARRDLDALSKLYIRSQRQGGYYFKQNGREMVTLDNPSYSGSDEEYLRQIRHKYIEEKKRIRIWMEAVFVCGEQAAVRMGTQECRVEVRGSLVEPAKSRPVLEEDIRRQLQKLGDSCFALDSLEIRTDGRGFYSLKEINTLRREAIGLLEDQIIAGHGLTVRRYPQQASPLPLPGEESKEELSTEYIAEKASQAGHVAEGKIQPGCGLRIHISTEEQLLYLADFFSAGQGSRKDREKEPEIKRLYIESHLLLQTRSHIQSGGKTETGGGRIRLALRSLQAGGIALWIALPHILRSKDEEIMRQALELYCKGKIQGFLVRNLEEYGWLEQRTEGGTVSQSIQLDHTVYVWNSRTADFWLKKGCGLTCPLELNSREWRMLLGQILRDGAVPEKLVYGRIPVMMTANCIARTAGKCLQGQASRSEGVLTDRYHKKFPVELCCDVCLNVIYNSVPLSLHREWETLDNVHKRLSFTTESGKEMAEILRFFADIADDRQPNPPFEDYTTGHEKRGVL
ncbi:MAG: U32 family peptidase [Acetatifactor sp.]|nr:U32 family peptidase [Acetatifactor sp.]